MPEINYDKTAVKVQKSNFDYPKFKMEKDELARVLVIEPNPVFEWVHELRAPKIADGAPVMETKKRKDNTEYQANVMDFLSKPICHGDLGVLDADGIDPKNCPMCRMAKQDSDMTKPPQRRFATNIIKYRTRGGTTDLVDPFSVECLVWSYTERMFGELASLKEEWDNLQHHDLYIECTNKMYQNYKISASKTAAWRESKERADMVKAVYAGGRIEDLSVACGSKKELRWIEVDLATINEKWDEVARLLKGGKGSSGTSLQDDLTALDADTEKWATPEQAASASTANDLDSMFDGIDSAPKERITDDAPVGGLDDDDLLGGSPEPAAPAAPAAETAPAKKAPAAEESVSTDELDDLLGV